MVIGIIGESCTGKTTIVNKLKETITLREYSGKDYLKVDKNPSNAKVKFKSMLLESYDEVIVYVITEKEHLEMLPEDATRVLVTADLELIKERFKKRMHNNLPKPVEMMIERKHGMFDNIKNDLHLLSDDLDDNIDKIINILNV